MTWPEAGFDDHAIHGPLKDLARLAKLIEAKVDTMCPGSTLQIREEFAAHSPYALLLEMRQDLFDPQLQTRSFLLKTPPIWTYNSVHINMDFKSPSTRLTGS